MNVRQWMYIRKQHFNITFISALRPWNVQSGVKDTHSYICKSTRVPTLFSTRNSTAVVVVNSWIGSKVPTFEDFTILPMIYILRLHGRELKRSLHCTWGVLAVVGRVQCMYIHVHVHTPKTFTYELFINQHLHYQTSCSSHVHLRNCFHLLCQNVFN